MFTDFQIENGKFNPKSVKFEVGLDKLWIDLIPPEHFSIKIKTPLYQIEVLSPAKIIILAIAPDKFLIKIISPDASLVTLVPKLVLEVYNSRGIRIIHLTAPPEKAK